MSRTVFYRDQKISVIIGFDYVLGEFAQIYDKEFQDETPEGEGLVFDWSYELGITTNYTGLHNTESTTAIQDIIQQYIQEHNENVVEDQE